jgi:hypothetical protein
VVHEEPPLVERRRRGARIWLHGSGTHPVRRNGKSAPKRFLCNLSAHLLAGQELAPRRVHAPKTDQLHRNGFLGRHRFGGAEPNRSTGLAPVQHGGRFVVIMLAVGRPMALPSASQMVSVCCMMPSPLTPEAVAHIVPSTPPYCDPETRDAVSVGFFLFVCLHM